MAETFSEDTLIADANGALYADNAIEVSFLLRDCAVDYFEEPCFYQSIDETARVNREGAVPVVGGEQDFDYVRWEAIFSRKAVDMGQPNVHYSGGLCRALAIARQGHLHGAKIMPHASNPSLVMLAAMTLMRVIPNAGPLIEYGIEDNSWLEEAFFPALEIVDGAVPFPEGTGWGIEVNPDWLKGKTYQESKLQK